MQNARIASAPRQAAPVILAIALAALVALTAAPASAQKLQVANQ